MHDYKLFWREFRTNFRTTGAVLPSGLRLSRALARFVRESCREPRHILEVGPGTGAVTRHIVSAMGDADRLDLVELNDEFVRRLREQLQTCPLLSPKAERIRVLHCPLEEVSRDVRYDLMISGLPLNNFAVSEVDAIIRILSELAQPNAVLSFFEYIGIRGFKALLAGREERARLRGIGQLLAQLLAEREIRREAVWRNVPPAWVHHVAFS